MRVLLLIVGLVTAVVTMTVWTADQPTAAQSAVQGCPACHGAAGREPALDDVAKKVKNHPASAAKTVTQCALCHTKGPTPAPFRQLLHKVHLNSAKFGSYKGTCTSCHNVDKTTGTVTAFGLER